MLEEDFDDHSFLGISDDDTVQSSIPYEDDNFDDQSFHGLSDDDSTNSRYSLGYDDSDENFGCITTTPPFVWKAVIKQRFAEFFNDRFQAEAFTSVEQFVTRHCLSDALQDDLLELLKMLSGKIIRPNFSVPVSCQTISSSATAESIIPNTVESGLAQTCNSPLTENTKPDSTACDIVITSESSTETSMTNNQWKRKLETSDEYPFKKMTSEMVAEKRETDHVFSAVRNMPCSSAVIASTPAQDTRHSAAKADTRQCGQVNVDDEGKIFCQVCDVTISGEANFHIHNSGKRHLKNLNRQQKLAPEPRRSVTVDTPKRWPCDMKIYCTENATLKLRKLYLEGEENVDN